MSGKCAAGVLAIVTLCAAGAREQIISIGGGSATVPSQVFTLCSGGPYVTTAVTTQETLTTCTIPAGRMGATGWLQVTSWWEFKDGSGNSTPGQKSVRMKWGTGATQIVGGNYGGTTFSGQLLHIVNTSAATQFSNGDNVAYGSGGNFGGFPRFTVNTALDQPLTWTCQKATAAENCTLVYYVVQLVVQ